MFLIDTIINGVTTVLDKVVPDANVREQVKAQLATQALDWYKLEVSDRESARQRESQTQDKTVRELAWVYTIGYFAILGGLLTGAVHVTPNQEGLLNVLMGVLTAGQYSVMQYYFGSSVGSASKNTAITEAMKRQSE